MILSLLAGFAAAAVCYALLRVYLRYPKPRALPVHIRAGEAAFLDAASDVMFPEGGAAQFMSLRPDLFMVSGVRIAAALNSG